MNNTLFSMLAAASCSADACLDFPLKFWRLFDGMTKDAATPSERWLAFGCGTLLSLLIAIIADLIIRKVLKRLTRHTATDLDDQLVDALQVPVVSALTLSGIYLSTALLHVGARTAMICHRVYLALIILIVMLLLLKMVRIATSCFKLLADRSGNSYNNLLINLLNPVFQAVIWVAGILFLLDNVFHLNIGALLAGAGIAAMAIAFAAQNTIANIFGAVSLILDRPFQIGQRIQVDGKDGIVEAIGLRSTRLRALDGTLWNIPNKTMTDSPILNLSVRPNFKHLFEINLVYDTTVPQLRRAKEILHEILDNHPLFDMEHQAPRITFAELGDSSLDVQALCWFQTTDFLAFSRAKEELMFQILEALDREGLEMAYPSQTVYMENLHPEAGEKSKIG